MASSTSRKLRARRDLVAVKPENHRYRLIELDSAASPLQPARRPDADHLVIDFAVLHLGSTTKLSQGSSRLVKYCRMPFSPSLHRTASPFHVLS